MEEPQTPFAPVRARFPFPGLAAAAARAALGGARESLLGTLMVARLATGMRPPHPLSLDARRARADQARQWLTALAVPAKLRPLLLRGIACSAQGDRTAMAEAVLAVTDVTAPQLDRVARLELARLAVALRADALALAGASDRPVE